MPTAPAIETRDLTKLYGATIGLEALDLAVEGGESFGLLGPNGSGKTTTIRLLLDLIRPSRGDARVLGQPVGDRAVRSRIGYLPGELALDGKMTGARTLEFLGALSGAPCSRRGEICERLGLDSRDLTRRVRDYSRGMKQKIGLVASFQHDPDLLILDEPTSGLDPLVRESLFELLADTTRAGKTVFQSSHVLSEVERTCSRLAIVREGKLLRVLHVEDVRGASVRRMDVRFRGSVPRDELSLPGVTLVECDGDRAVLRVTGDLNPLLEVLSRHAVVHLAFPEPTLEEAFVELYRGNGAAS
ncbi:MAG: ABC transporter ATP-binding protein [bacterium]|nr:ABC transporter ATP-binding protein [bacterium]